MINSTNPYREYGGGMSRFQSQVYSKSSQLTKKLPVFQPLLLDLLELAKYVDRFIKTFNSILWIRSILKLVII